jgi:hypothetical protein
MFHRKTTYVCLFVGRVYIVVLFKRCGASLAMPETVKVRLRLGPDRTEEFAQFWNNEVEKDAALSASATSAVFRPSVTASGGLGLSVPPEILLGLLSGAAGALGKGAVELLWEKLKLFFRSRKPGELETLSGPVLIIVGGKKFVFDSREMPDAPPKALLELT